MLNHFKIHGNLFFTSKGYTDIFNALSVSKIGNKSTDYFRC